MTKIRMIVLPPETQDGSFSTPFDPVKEGECMLECLQHWAENGYIDDEITLKIVEMTQEEIDAVPEA